MNDADKGVKSGGVLKSLDMRIVSMMLILLAMWIFFRFQLGGYYFSGESIAKLSRDMATWTILSAGMTLVIVAGYIDLSVGSLLGLVVASCAFMIDRDTGLGWSATLAVPLAILLGLVAGLWQGMLVAHFRIPAFIVTLGGLFIFRAFTQRVSANDPAVPGGSWVNVLGFSFVPPAAGLVLAGLVCLALIVLVFYGEARKKRMGLQATLLPVLLLKIIVPCVLLIVFVVKVNQYNGIPSQTLIMGFVLAVLGFIARKTLLGRRVFAVGGNSEAARLSGISVERTTIIVFGLMGLLTGVAGVVWMAQNQGSTQKAGEWYELYAIASCVIGGTSLMGGRGSVFGSLLGALVMATVIQGMDYNNSILENWMQLGVRGAILVLAVAIDIAGRDPAPWMRRLRSRLGRRV